VEPQRLLRALDFTGEELRLLDAELSKVALEDDDRGQAVRRLMTIPGVDAAVALSVVAGVGEFTRFRSPEKLVAYPAVGRAAPAGAPVRGAAGDARADHQGRPGAHTRGMLVEAAWAASKARGPLRGFYQRIQARRGRQIAVVATARKLVVLCWHLSVKGEDYAFARPSLIAHKQRKLELRAGQPAARGRKGPASGYYHPAVRDAERRLAEQAEHAYRTFTAAWQPTPPPGRRQPPAPTPVGVGVDVAAATRARLPKPTKGQAARQG
jgi:hypothetical protein